MKTIIVFVFSFFFALLLLMAERLIGIGWDFHPDSVTYVTESTTVSKAIFEGQLSDLINNAYYVVCYFLNESIFDITLFNLTLYSITNIFLAKVHWGFDSGRKNIFSIFLLLLLLNPYRAHLATTVLKDTLIIFLVVISALNFRKFLALIPLLILLRMASIIYGFIFLSLVSS